MTEYVSMPLKDHVVVSATLRDGTTIESQPMPAVIADQKHRLEGSESSRAYETPAEFGWLPEDFAFDQVVSGDVRLIDETD